MREDYMVSRVSSETVGGTRKLIVCGAEHLKGLEVRFLQNGEKPTTRDLTKENWALNIYTKKEEFLLGPRVGG